MLVVSRWDKCKDLQRVQQTFPVHEEIPGVQKPMAEDPRVLDRRAMRCCEADDPPLRDGVPSGSHYWDRGIWKGIGPDGKTTWKFMNNEAPPSMLNLQEDDTPAGAGGSSRAGERGPEAVLCFGLLRLGPTTQSSNG